MKSELVANYKVNLDRTTCAQNQGQLAVFLLRHMIEYCQCFNLNLTQCRPESELVLPLRSFLDDTHEADADEEEEAKEYSEEVNTFDSLSASEDSGWHEEVRLYRSKKFRTKRERERGKPVGNELLRTIDKIFENNPNMSWEVARGIVEKEFEIEGFGAGKNVNVGPGKYKRTPSKDSEELARRLAEIYDEKDPDKRWQHVRALVDEDVGKELGLKTWSRATVLFVFLR